MQKDEMYLHKRKNGFYYFRRRVSADLIGIIDPKEFHYSLGTNVRREASACYGAAFMQSEHKINSERVRLARLAMRPHVSQEDLSGRLAARGIQITQTGISKLENRQRYVMDYEALAIAKALKVSVSWLYGQSQNVR